MCRSLVINLLHAICFPVEVLIQNPLRIYVELNHSTSRKQHEAYSFHCRGLRRACDCIRDCQEEDSIDSWQVQPEAMATMAVTAANDIVEAQSLFDHSMFVQDDRYDASYNYIAYNDKGSWSVRFTAWYLAGLLHRNQGDDLEHAKAAIENIISVQMIDDFDTAWYGIYKLSPDQPDPTPHSTTYSPKIYEVRRILCRRS